MSNFAGTSISIVTPSFNQGQFIPRATEIARAWRADYPDTFKYFSETWGVDPKDLTVRDRARK